MKKLSKKEIQIAAEVLLAKHDLCFFSKDSHNILYQSNQSSYDIANEHCVFLSSRWFKKSTRCIEQFLESFLSRILIDRYGECDTIDYRGIYLEAAGILLSGEDLIPFYIDFNLIGNKRYARSLKTKKLK